MTALKFLDDNLLASCGDCDGIVKVWDLRRSYSAYTGVPKPKYQLRRPEGSSCMSGFVSMTADRAKRRLFVACGDHFIYEFDSTSFESKIPARKLRGAKFDNYFIRLSLSCDGRYLASGSSEVNDEFSRVPVWDVSKTDCEEPAAELLGQWTAPTTCVAWSKNDLKLFSCADDLRHRFWELFADEEVGEEEFRGEARLMATAKKRSLKMIRKSFVESLPLEGTKHFINDENSDKKTFKRKIFQCEEGGNDEFKRPPEAKRPRRPFSSSTQNLPCSPKKMNIVHISPRKSAPSITQNSPGKLSVSFSNPPKIFSPTTNLPNLVRNGLSPRTKIISPQPKKSSANWLQQLSEKKEEFD